MEISLVAPILSLSISGDQFGCTNSLSLSEISVVAPILPLSLLMEITLVAPILSLLVEISLVAPILSLF